MPQKHSQEYCQSKIDRKIRLLAFHRKKSQYSYKKGALSLDTHRELLNVTSGKIGKTWSVKLSRFHFCALTPGVIDANIGYYASQWGVNFHAPIKTSIAQQARFIWSIQHVGVEQRADSAYFIKLNPVTQHELQKIRSIYFAWSRNISHRHDIPDRCYGAQSFSCARGAKLESNKLYNRFW